MYSKDYGERYWTFEWNLLIYLMEVDITIYQRILKNFNAIMNSSLPTKRLRILKIGGETYIFRSLIFPHNDKIRYGFAESCYERAVIN